MALTWRSSLVVGGAFVLGTSVFLRGAAAEAMEAVQVVVGVWCAVVMVRCAARQHRGHRLSWVLLTGAQVCWLALDVVWSGYQLLPGAAERGGNVDFLYLLSYPLLGAALLRLAHERRYRLDVGALLDSAVVTLGVGLLAWVVLVVPTLHADVGSPGGRLVDAAYPVGDVVVLALLAHLVAVPGVRSTPYRLLVASIGVLLVTDAAYSLLLVVAPTAAASLGGAWLVSYLLVGAAAMHPDAHLVGSRDPAFRRDTAARLSTRRLVALTAAVLVAPSVLAVQLVVGGPLAAWPVVIASVGLFGLVVARMALATRDVTRSAEQRERLRTDLAHQVAHDSLTGLVARAHALELVELALARSRRSGALVGLVFLGLDRFKAVNDAHGHRAGDEVLREVAVRLEAAVRSGDVVGRLGGDEFVVLVEPLESGAALMDLAERLVAAVSAPVRAGARTVEPGASAGVVVDLGGASTAAELLHDAESAAQRAKARGRGRVEVFDEDLRRELVERTALERAMRSGLTAGEFVLHYQPVVDVVSGAVGSYEALVRWHRPGHGTVPPDAFIPTAERSDLVCELGRWVLREATAQLVAWEAEALADGLAGLRPTVAVNLSGRHLVDPRVVEDVAGALAASGVLPGQLVLEITETVLVDALTATAQIRRLQDLGVGISIDDFGTGYTSIGQLQHLTADTLKIDRSLVASDDPGAAELVRLVVQAAHAFGLSVVAEGVEREDQLAALRAAGCDRAQGWLFARAQPAAEITAGLRAARAVAQRPADPIRTA